MAFVVATPRLEEGPLAALNMYAAPRQPQMVEASKEARKETPA